MHEFSLMNSLMNKINGIAQQQQAQRVSRVQVKLGALSHMSPEHFEEHFVQAARGGIAENATLDIRCCDDQKAEYAQDIVLEAVDVITP